MTGHTVYQFIDAHGQPIYVGYSRTALARFEQHARASWWPHVASIRVEHFADAKDALARERALIAEMRPWFNVQGNDGDDLGLCSFSQHCGADAVTVHRVERPGRRGVRHYRVCAEHAERAA
jgi:excinuclease UvrABC nuclease subunit